MELASFICQLHIVINYIPLTETNKVLNSFWNFFSKHVNFNVSCTFSSNLDTESDGMSGL